VYYDKAILGLSANSKAFADKLCGKAQDQLEPSNHPPTKGAPDARRPASDQRAAPPTFELFQNAALSS